MRKLTITFTIIFLALLAVDAYPGLRGGAGWRWPYQLPDSWWPVVALAMILCVYLAGVYLLRIRAPQSWFGLMWSVLAGALIAVAVVGVRGDSGFLLFTRTVSPVQTGASTIAVHDIAVDGLQTTLEDWPDVMRQSLDENIIHFATSPPGQPLIHYTLAHIFDTTPFDMTLRHYQCSNLNVMSYTSGEIASAGMGVLMPLWAALAVLPVYASANMLTRDKSVAVRVAQWWPLVPTVLLFAPTWNTLYPALGVTVFAFLLTAFEQDKNVFALLAGVVLSITTFLNFAVLPVLLLLGLFTLGYWHFVKERAGGVLWALRVGLWFGIGLSSVWIIYWLVSGNTLFDLWRVSYENHKELVRRDYLPWLLLHPYDVLMFAGWPLVALFAVGVWDSTKRIREKTRLSTSGVLALSTFVTFVLVDLSGTAQGENARIMSFYAPFFLLSGCGLFVIRAGQKPVPRNWDMPLLAAQSAVVLVLAAVLSVVPLDLNPVPEGPYTDVMTLHWMESIPVGAAFKSDNYQGEFQLEGYRFVADPAEQAITLETIWRGNTQVERPYMFEFIAYAENEIDGEIISEPFRWYAQNGAYLPTCWQNGDEIHDTQIIPLPAVSMPVIWTIELRLVDERTGDVARVIMDDGTTSDAVILGQVNYP